MTEKDIEMMLVNAVKGEGGICPKFISPGTNGMPDRIVLLPEGHMGFVEVKAPGERPRKIQLRRHARLRTLGFPVFLLDDPDEIPGILSAIRNGGR